MASTSEAGIAAPLAAPKPITHRRVMSVALPIVLSNVTVPILGAVDTGVVGQLGEAAPIGAVGLGAVILSTVYWIFGFLRMGTVGLVGQAEGRGDAAEVSAILSRALLIAGAGGLAIIALQLPIISGALLISDPGDEVATLTQDYLSIRIWSAPFAIATYAFTGWLVAMERTGAVFLIQVVINGLNIILDVVFVLGFGWGVEGVAAATVIAEVVGGLYGLWLCRAAFARPDWKDAARVFAHEKIVTMMVLNGDILIRSALLMAIFTSFTVLAARLGEVPLAANTVLVNFLFIVAHALDGFAFAAETLVARAFGRRDRARVRRASALTSIWGMAICVVLSLTFALAGGALIDVMATSPDVREEARRYLWWMVAAPIAGAPGWMFDGIFIGATRSADMRNMMIVSAILYAAAVAILLPTLGNDGLWAALLISFIARGATLGVRYPALERAAEGR
ncbi:MAG: MATE family efflux transporter [Pseudomonadota bacterium]